MVLQIGVAPGKMVLVPSGATVALSGSKQIEERVHRQRGHGGQRRASGRLASREAIYAMRCLSFC